MIARTRQRGFTLVELMIALVLLTLLLTAIAAGTHACLSSYAANTKSTTMTQTVRVLLMRLRREVRGAEAVDFEAPANKLVIFPPPSDGGVQKVEYEYDSDAGTFTYSQTIDGDVTSQVVLSRSTAVTMTDFSVDYDVVEKEGVDCTQRAVVTMTVQIDGVSSTVVCSASPRRNQEY